MSLPNDVSRCAGVISFDPFYSCVRRLSCQRYKQMAEDSKKYPDGIPIPISYTSYMGKPDGACDYYREMSDDPAD